MLQSRAGGDVYSNRSTVIESAMNSEPEYYRFHREDVAQPESPEFSSFQKD